MSWNERLLYIGLIVGLYCMGRWQSENRAIVHQGLRAKEFVLALKQNRIEDLQYRLTDDLSVAAYNSYTPFSFGPDLWQKPLPKGNISIMFEEPASVPLGHSPKQPTPKYIQSPSTPPPVPDSEPVNQKQETTEAVISDPSLSSETKPINTP